MLGACDSRSTMSNSVPHSPDPSAVPAHAQTAVLGGGCFWCLEAAFRQLGGVLSVTSGYMGGHTANPTYEQVCTGATGHAEVVRILFDPERISYAEILGWFWRMHDPTTLNRQGGDVGTQYRSVIFHTDEAQKQTAEASKSAAAAGFTNPIVTEISPAGEFHPAEGLHQNYYFQNKSSNPYCRMVIQPKLEKLKLEH